MRRIIILVSILFLMGVFAYGWIAHNYSCVAFPNQCENDSKESGNQTIGYMIIEAASYFLQSNSDYQSILKEIELSEINGINYEGLQRLIDNAIENIEHSKSIYNQILQISKVLDYDPVVLEKLRQFDYHGLQSQENLNDEIFQKVVIYLKNGDVIGAYRWSYEATKEISEILKTIKSSLNNVNLPEIKIFWRLNQLYFETELFGQYVSEIFYNL